MTVKSCRLSVRLKYCGSEAASYRNQPDFYRILRISRHRKCKMLIKNRVKRIKGEKFPFSRQETPRPPYGASRLAPLRFFGMCGIATNAQADTATQSGIGLLLIDFVR